MITATFRTFKYLSLIALLDLSWMAEFFTELSLVTLQKSSLRSKFLNNFRKKAMVLNNGCNTIYLGVQNIQNVGRWVALLNSVLRIRIVVKCMLISSRV